MEHLDPPDEREWDERRLWFEALDAARVERGVGPLSEQACALMVDLQVVFCAGAWSATVIIAAAIVDAQSYYAGFPMDGLEPERAWLRGLRNRLLHEDRSDPALTLEDHWTNRRNWEKHARRAVELAFATIYPATSERRRPPAAPGRRRREGAPRDE